MKTGDYLITYISGGNGNQIDYHKVILAEEVVIQTDHLLLVI